MFDDVDRDELVVTVERWDDRVVLEFPAPRRRVLLPYGPARTLAFAILGQVLAGTAEAEECDQCGGRRPEAPAEEFTIRIDPPAPAEGTD